MLENLLNRNKNIGRIDRISRFSLAVVAAVLYSTKQITGTAAIVLGIFAFLWILTSMIGFSPVYSLLKISTIKKK